MFDIGFWELLLVAVIALVVVGPDRLPGLVRTTGRWLGRARHYAGMLRDEFEREAQRAEELKELAQMRIELEEKERALAERRATVPVDGRKAATQSGKDAPAPEAEPSPPRIQPPSMDDDLATSRPDLKDLPDTHAVERGKVH